MNIEVKFDFFAAESLATIKLEVGDRWRQECDLDEVSKWRRLMGKVRLGRDK